MIVSQQIAKARAVEADAAWWAQWDAFQNAPVDRSPEGQALHDQLYAEFAAKLEAAKASGS